MTRTRRMLVLAGLLAAARLGAAPPSAPPTLKMPGQPDRPVPRESLLGRDERDVRLEDVDGNVTIYHGMTLLDVLEKNGLDLKTMAGERKSAASVVVVTARDGYTVAFSVGELKANRANPKVFLVSETTLDPLPENEGPVRLIVYGDPVRSSYGLATIELKNLGPQRP
jgi:hypothetical protein